MKYLCLLLATVFSLSNAVPIEVREGRSTNLNPRFGRFLDSTGANCVYFDLSAMFTTDELTAINNAITQIQTDLAGCVTFKNIDTTANVPEDEYFVMITPQNADGTAATSCTTGPGRDIHRNATDPQRVILAQGTGVGACALDQRQIMRILINLLGKRNEFQRPDRSDFITVDRKQIDRMFKFGLGGVGGPFDTYSQNNDVALFYPYDLCSITQVDTDYLAKDGQNVFTVAHPAGFAIRDDTRLSNQDCLAIRTLYKCTTTCPADLVNCETIIAALPDADDDDDDMTAGAGELCATTTTIDAAVQFPDGTIYLFMGTNVFTVPTNEMRGIAALMPNGTTINSVFPDLTGPITQAFLSEDDNTRRIFDNVSGMPVEFFFMVDTNMVAATTASGATGEASFTSSNLPNFPGNPGVSIRYDFDNTAVPMQMVTNTEGETFLASALFPGISVAMPITATVSYFGENAPFQGAEFVDVFTGNMVCTYRRINTLVSQPPGVFQALDGTTPCVPTAMRYTCPLA